MFNAAELLSAMVSCLANPLYCMYVQSVGQLSGSFKFSLNVFTEFSDKKYYFKKIPVLEPTISCVRNRDSTTVPQTQLAEKTVKLILIHASVIFQISWIC